MIQQLPLEHAPEVESKVEPGFEALVAQGAGLSELMVDAAATYEALPSEVRIELACQAVVEHRREVEMWVSLGADPNVEVEIFHSYHVMTQRLTYLADEERETALREADTRLAGPVGQ